MNFRRIEGQYFGVCIVFLFGGGCVLGVFFSFTRGERAGRGFGFATAIGFFKQGVELAGGKEEGRG
jgi:hypothetical protein